MTERRNGRAEALRSQILERINARDRAGAVRLGLDAVSDGQMTIPGLYRSVLSHILVDTGAAWQAGLTRVWEEHYATNVIRTIVEALYPTVGRLGADARRRVLGEQGEAKKVLLALPSQETHDLGLRMLADRFELAGWDAYFLGADTPEDEIVESARTLGVDAITLSVATHFHKVGLRHLVSRLEKSLPGVRIWVGGAGLAHDRSGFSDDELLDPDALLDDGD